MESTFFSRNVGCFRKNNHVCNCGICRLPSMTLTNEERKEKLEIHRTASKIAKSNKKAELKLKEIPKPLDIDYSSATKERKEKQAKYWEKHLKVVDRMLIKLRNVGKIGTFSIDEATKLEDEPNGVCGVAQYLSLHYHASVLSYRVVDKYERWQSYLPSV